MTNRISNELAFALRFYEQTAEAIVAVVESARRSHAGLVSWTQTVDPAASKPCIAVTLKFSDRASFDAFIKDEQFIDTYLANAWGRRPLTRDALRVKPSRSDERGTIPRDMFAEVGI